MRGCEGVRVGASRHLSGQFLVLLRLACEDMPLLVDHLLHHLGTPQADDAHLLNRAAGLAAVTDRSGDHEEEDYVVPAARVLTR